MRRDDESVWVGRVIADKYRVMTCIGSGASARVYRAEVVKDTDSLHKGALIALKISRPHVLGKQRDAARFLREVQAINRIDHRCCIEIYDWGITDDCAYIAMELLEADDLYEIIRWKSPLSQTRSVAIAIEICGALMAAHKQGVVHRDLKPRNIVLMHDGEGGVVEPRIKVLDFGLAKLFRHGADEEETMPDALTKPGSVLGTPHYMAPEQVSVDGEIDGRADVYAAAVILYEMITGTRPYKAKNAVRLLIMRSSSDPDLPRKHRPDIDPQLERIILKGLARDQDERFASADAFRRALANVFPRIAEEEEDVSLGNIPPDSLDGASGSISSMPPDTIQDEHTPHDEKDDEVPTALMDRPSFPEEPPESEDYEDDIDTTTHLREQLQEEEPAESEPPPAKPRRRSLQPVFYYTVTVIALGAAIARLLGLW